MTPQAPAGVGSRWWVIAAGLAVLHVAVTIIVLRQTVLNADDIWVQVLWSEWRPFATEVSLPRDSYVLHAVVAIPIEALFGRTLTAIALTTVVLNLAALALFVRFALFLARRLQMTDALLVVPVALATTWYVLLGNQFTAFAARPNHRNVELGLMLFVVQELVELSERQKLDARAVAAVAVTTIAFFNDPMLVIAAGLPWASSWRCAG